MKEIWADINEYYKVSNLGRVKSVDRVIGNTFYASRILKPSLDTYGYPIVGLRINDKMSTKTVHRLVAIAFVPNPDNKATVNHKDGNKLNNAAYNLEWMTFGENNTHSHQNGTHDVVGESNGRAKLTVEQVVAIREEYATGKTSYPKLARKYGVGWSQISRIINKQQWSHLL